MVLQYLLRSWLQNAAREKIRQTVTEAAKEAAAGRGEPNAEGEEEAHPFTQLPCQAGLVFGLASESGGVEDMLEGGVAVRGDRFMARQGLFAGRHVVLTRSGGGATAVRRATAALIAGHHPPWIIATGFAIALQPKVKRFEMLMADELIDSDGGRLKVDLRVDPEVLAKTPGVRVGPLLSVDEEIRTVERKQRLAEQFDAVAVDRESFAVAEICRERRVRFLAVRVVTELAEEELSPELRNVDEQASAVGKLGATVGAVWRKPGTVKDMVRGKEHALVASDRLGRFLASMIEQLIP